MTGDMFKGLDTLIAVGCCAIVAVPILVVALICAIVLR